MRKEFKIIQGDAGKCQQWLNEYNKKYFVEVIHMDTDIHYNRGPGYSGSPDKITTILATIEKRDPNWPK